MSSVPGGDGPRKPRATRTQNRVAVVGGGIAGLAAAWELHRHDVDVVVFEAGDRVGGKLRASEVPGVEFPIDEGADAFLARVPDAVQLCDELGIETLEHPLTGTAFVYARGALRPLPAAHVLGVPADVEGVVATGLLSDDGVAELRNLAGRSFDPPAGDMSVADLVGERLGAEAVTHLVEPLLGGINAGEATGLSAAAVAPQIWALTQRGGSLVDAARAARAAIDTSAPVFAAPAGGMAELVDTLVARLPVEIRTGTAIGQLDVGDDVTIDGETFAGIVVATPAPVSAGLLSDVAPDAARLLADIGHASVVMVTVVADAATVDHPLDGSGFVVARDAGVDITACSWGSSKWTRWNDGRHAVFRVSLGHDADTVDWCDQPDEFIVSTVLADLALTMGAAVDPIGVRITRWPSAFPQYRPGHLDRVDAIGAAVAAVGPIRLASSALGGIGVPACIRQGRAAARALLG